MNKNSLLQTSTLWINIFLLIFIYYPSKANADDIIGFNLDKGYSQSSFKFKSAQNLIIMPVVVDGRKLNLIFDTGSNSILIFDKKSITSWRNREKHIIRFSGLGKGSVIKGFRIDNLSVKMPKINGNGLSLVVTPSSPFPREIGGVKVHGIFGYQLLAKFIVQIDYKNEIITLADPHYFVPPLKSSIVDLNIFNTKPYIKCPVIINQSEHYLNLLVDTGAEAALILRRKSLTIEEKFGNSQVIGVGLSGKIMGTKVTVNDLVLGSHHLSKDFEAWVAKEKSFPNESAKIIRDGTIGGETLRQFKVTFDYFNNKLYLESSNPKTIFYNSSIVKNE